MRKPISIFIACIIVFSLSLASASAEQTLLDSVAAGCEKEIAAHCEDVIIGQGRVLACLYAHSDKLSNKCEYSLYDAAIQLERAISAMTYTIYECSEDLDKFCGGVAAGEGRLLDCLEDNKSAVSGRCKDALQVALGFK